ncbi:hypothetical protein A3K73_07440 [Candidatus Pacearchaeota archaeon RBG_13_36_9]|nr:MAG: hypothetical protein A3K73_07440 [Candidatus Pacearchaeota archaeon RBG_13_36_9]
MRLRKIGGKKALSEIVSYVLLILIAFVIGTAVFVWMRHMINDPSKNPQCPDGVSIVIRNAVCDDTNNEVTLTIANQGRFDIAGFVVKGSNNPNVIAAVGLTPNDAPPKLTNIENLNVLPNDLGTGKEDSYKFSYSTLTALSKISVMAIRNQSDEMVVCTSSLIGQDVSCS